MVRNGPRAWLTARWLLFGAFVWLLSGYDPRLLAVDWQAKEPVPFHVSDSLEIAEKWFPLKRGSISLLCSVRGLHLVTRTRLPFPGYVRDNFRISDDVEFDESAYFGFANAGDSSFKFSFEVNAAIVELGVVDTIVTEPLAPDDVELISRAFSKSASHRISLVIAETGNGFAASASASEVNRFTRKCRGRSDTSRHADNAV